MANMTIDISIVIPCYNEVESLQELYGKLCKVLQPITSAFELIFVDDGSIDRSMDVLQELRMRQVTLSCPSDSSRMPMLVEVSTSPGTASLIRMTPCGVP